MLDIVKYTRVNKREAHRLYDDGKTLVMSLDRPWCAMGEAIHLTGVTTVTKPQAGQTFEELEADALQWKHRYPGSQGLVWYTPAEVPARFAPVAGPAVLMGMYIPAHDQTFDLAEDLGKTLDAFHDYVATVRDAEQADAAVKELLSAFLTKANEEKDQHV